MEDDSVEIVRRDRQITNKHSALKHKAPPKHYYDLVPGMADIMITITEWWRGFRSEDRPVDLNIETVARSVLKISEPQLTRKSRILISKALYRLNFVRKLKRGSSVQVYTLDDREFGSAAHAGAVYRQPVTPQIVTQHNPKEHNADS